MVKIILLEFLILFCSFSYLKNMKPDTNTIIMKVVNKYQTFGNKEI
jgi:hypothetical protein